MATLRLPDPDPDNVDRHHVLRALGDVVWVLVIGLIALYALFVGMGAFSPGDAVGVTIAVGVLLIGFGVWAWVQGHKTGTRDPRITAARERRGF